MADNDFDVTQFLNNSTQGAAPGDTGTSDPMSGFMSALANNQAAQAQPNQAQAQAPGAPTFQSGSQTGIVPMAGIQDQDLGMVKDIIGRLNTNDPSNKNFMDRLNKTFSYTPEQRAQDMYDKLFGITRTKDTQGNTTNVKHNWGQFLTGMIGEALRGANEKGGYIPPMERFRQQAQGQFQAEAVPLAKELQYKTQEELSLLNTAQNYMWHAGQLSSQEALRRIQSQKNEIYAFINNPDNPMNVARKQELLAKADQATSDVELNKLRGVAELETAQLRAAQTGKAKQETQNIQEGANPTEMMGKAFNLMQQGKNDEAQKLIDMVKQMYTYQHPGTISVQDFGNGPVPMNNRTGATGPSALPTPPTAMPGINAPLPTTDGKTPVNKQDWPSPYDQYGPRAAALGGSQITNMRNTPTGHTPQNDSNLWSPGQKLNATDDKEVKAAMYLYQLWDEFNGVLKKVPDSTLTPIVGNWDKFVMGKVPTDPNLRQLQSLYHAISLAHMGTQGTRSGQLSENLVKIMNTPGTGRQEMVKSVEGLVGQSANILRDNPGSKQQMAQLLNATGGDYYDLMKIYNPDQYSKEIKKLAQAELDKRKAVKK